MKFTLDTETMKHDFELRDTDKSMSQEQIATEFIKGISTIIFSYISRAVPKEFYDEYEKIIVGEIHNNVNNLLEMFKNFDVNDFN